MSDYVHLRRVVWQSPPTSCFTGRCSVPGCPGYPKGDGRSHGIGAERIEMAVVGTMPNGKALAVNFTYSTGKYLDQEGLPDFLREPMAWDLGYHVEPYDAPEGEYHGSEMKECSLLGGTCWYDGSGLQAEPYLKALQVGGADVIWPMLENEWRYRAGEFSPAEIEQPNKEIDS